MIFEKQRRDNIYGNVRQFDEWEVMHRVALAFNEVERQGPSLEM
jgi:hypothetical protein